jgi:hypothetical protein
MLPQDRHEEPAMRINGSCHCGNIAFTPLAARPKSEGTKRV